MQTSDQNTADSTPGAGEPAPGGWGWRRCVCRVCRVPFGPSAGHALGPPHFREEGFLIGILDGLKVGSADLHFVRLNTAEKGRTIQIFLSAEHMQNVGTSKEHRSPRTSPARGTAGTRGQEGLGHSEPPCCSAHPRLPRRTHGAPPSTGPGPRAQGHKTLRGCDARPSCCPACLGATGDCRRCERRPRGSRPARRPQHPPPPPQPLCPLSPAEVR